MRVQQLSVSGNVIVLILCVFVAIEITLSDNQTACKYSFKQNPGLFHGLDKRVDTHYKKEGKDLHVSEHGYVTLSYT